MFDTGHLRRRWEAVNTALRNLTGVGVPVLIVALSLFVVPFVDLSLVVADIIEFDPVYDFVTSYYGAARGYLAGEAVYANPEHPYIYPPLTLLLWLPFVVFDPLLAGVVWDIVVLGVLYASVLFLLSSRDISLNTRWRFGLLAALVGFYPTILWLKAGQVSGLLAALLCVAAGLSGGDEGPRHGILTGAILAVVSLFKPFYAVAATPVPRKNARLVGGVLGVAVVILAGLAIFGIDMQLAQFDYLLTGLGWGETAEAGGGGSSPTNWGPYYFRPFIVFGGFALYVKFALVALLAVVSIASRWMDSTALDERLFVLGFTAVPLLSPISDLFAVNALIPALVLTSVAELRREESLIQVPLFTVLMIQIHPYLFGFLASFGPRYVPQLRVLEPVLPLLQPALWGIFALVGLQLYRISKEVDF
ncbi:glycosyltransferase 87 family protein [Halogeometricum borinquense]|uniref:glycosyltransferase 87 family protein n=1 Tax=Halogeometricum borinquense TaxID=60847 RepID=UPI00341E8C5C